MVSIIDADGHVDEPRAVWQEYTEPAYRDQVIQLVRDQDGMDKLKIEGKVRGDGTLSIAAACIPNALTDAEKSKVLSWDDVPPGGYDPHARLAVMDQEGIEVAFLYPSLWLMFGDIRDPQVAAVACRAYNMICHPFEQMAACMDIVCGGVLEKFPKLRVAFFESGAGWLAYWLQRMDDHYEKMGRFAPWLKKKPSEYFREQCFISLDANDGPLMKSLVELGVEDCIVWGSDYPHFDCTFPGVLQEVKESVAGLSKRARFPR